jgi:hypothetical protein
MGVMPPCALPGSREPGEGPKFLALLAPMVRLLPLVTPVDPLADGCD